MKTKDVNSWHWFGNLTIENCQSIADTIEKMLTGKRYSFATFVEGLDRGVELRVSQGLEGGRDNKNVHAYGPEPDKDYQSAGFNVCDTYGVWGAATSAHDGDQWDSTYKTPYLVFEYDRKIEITQQNGYGDKIHWTVVVEDATD